MGRSRTVVGVALAAVGAIVLAACGGGGPAAVGAAQGGVYADCATAPKVCNAVPVEQLKAGGSITLAIEKNIPNWNLTSSAGNVFETGQVMKAILPLTFFTAPDLTSVLNKDLLLSAEITATTPQTVVYKIRPEAVWSDGQPITADDFVYNWKVQNNRDCPTCKAAGNGGYQAANSVTGSDGGKTVTVTFGKPYTDWKSLWSSAAPLYPAHLAAKQGDLATPDGLAAAFSWFSDTVPTYAGGPYQVTNWQNNVALTMTPNPKWYGATKPRLDQVIFRVITDATQEPLALQNNEVQVLYPQPQVDLVQQLKGIPGVSQYQGLGLTWEHYNLQLANPFLADKALRLAMFTAVDRQSVINKTVGQFNDKVPPLNSLVFVQGLPGYQDNLRGSLLGSGNLDAARKILTDAGYTGIAEGQQLTRPDGRAVPPLRIRYTTGNAIRQTESELFAAAVKPLGITVQVVPTSSLGDTLAAGDYDIIAFAWVQTPFPFSGATQLWLSTSNSNYAHYTNPLVDQLIDQAASSTDEAVARAKLNEADRLMLADAFDLPIYQKPTIAAVRNEVANVRNNSSLDGVAYNIAEWGLRAP